MGYLSIDNLYKCQDVLLMKEVYSLEKIHGTSAHLSYNEERLGFFAGGVPHDNFKVLFDEAELLKRFQKLGLTKVMVYGEAYGGKCQGMSATYGKQLKFVVFDIRIGYSWLAVPDMQQIAETLGLETVHWERCPSTVEEFNRLRDMPSVQAIRNGCGPDKPREGIVIRPLIELIKNNGERVICKHKGEKFSERATPQKIVDPAKLKVLTDANAIAEEWVTPMRLSHVLDKLPLDVRDDIGNMRIILDAMVDDIRREAKGEIVESKEVERGIRTRTACLFKQRLQNKLNES